MNSLPLVILAAGKNSRFFPLNYGTHKGFFELCGEPLIVNLLRSAEIAGVEKVFIIVSSKENNENNQSLLRSFNFKLEISFIEQVSPLGMGNALLLAKDHLQGRFLVASPYHVNSSTTLLDLIRKQEETSAECVLIGTHTENPERYGILQTAADKVTGVIEKPQKPISKIKLSSLYLLSSKMLDILSNLEVSEYNFETALNKVCETNDVRWIEGLYELPTLKYAWDLHALKTKLLSNKKSYSSPTAQIAKTAIIDDEAGQVLIADGAQIKDFVTIVGPAFIGENALIGNYSMIRESSVERNCIVGAYTEIVRSILSPGVSIHQSYCADSILGSKTKVGAGLVTANKRLDRRNVKVKVKNELVDSGVNGFGLITGESVQLGISVATMPGTLVGNHVQVFPNQELSHTIDPNSLVINNGK